MVKNGSLDGVSFFSNRASQNFIDALCPFGGAEANNNSAVIDLTYFEMYGGKTLPFNLVARHCLMERQLTIPLDNKLLFAKQLKLNGVCDPQVYFSPKDVPSNLDSLWFIKNPMSTSGKGMKVVCQKDLAKVFQDGFIIQQAVSNLMLINERKFTVRVYILIFNNNIYIYPDGFMIIHGAKYNAQSIDYNIQIQHDGYQDVNSLIELKPLQDSYFHMTFLGKVSESLPGILRLFKSLKKAKVTDYVLLGLDYLITDELEPKLIEINDRPNLLHTKVINNDVNVPMISSLVHTVLDIKQDVGEKFRNIGVLFDYD